MANEDNKVAQLLRIYQAMSAEDRNAAYDVIRRHQQEVTVERKGDLLVEGMRKYGAFMGPSSGGCPRCGYPN